jgi:aldose 1-epimerase
VAGALLFITGGSAGAQSKPDPARAAGKSGVTRAPFGKLPDGTAIESFTLRNAHGIEVRAITYGAIIVSLRVPDRAGRFGDVVLGNDDLAGYLDKPAYFGAVVGRYGNRIAAGRCPGRQDLRGHNNGPNHLHGGCGVRQGRWKATRRRRGDVVTPLRAPTAGGYRASWPRA